MWQHEEGSQGAVDSAGRREGAAGIPGRTRSSECPPPLSPGAPRPHPHPRGQDPSQCPPAPGPPPTPGPSAPQAPRAARTCQRALRDPPRLRNREPGPDAHLDARRLRRRPPPREGRGQGGATQRPQRVSEAPAAPPADWLRAGAGPPVQTGGGAWRSSSRAAALAVGLAPSAAPPPPTPRSPRAALVRLRQGTGGRRGPGRGGG